MEKVITIEGMSCKHCQAKVENILRGIDGVTDVHVDLQKREHDALLEYL